MAPQSPSFDDLPRHIVASFILPYISSTDWLRFRVSSRGCYQTVHGSADDVSQFVCPKCRHAPTMRCNNNATAITFAPSNENNTLSEKLWKLALVRDFLFEETDHDDDNQDLVHQSFHSPTKPVSDALVSTQNMFKASNLFVSWMHWQKLYLRLDSPASCEQIPGPYFIRASSMWQKIEQWCNDRSRSRKLGRVIKSSLLPGRKVNAFLNGDSVGWLAFQAVYAFYAGQCDSSSEKFREYSGLFGSFQAYGVALDTRWSEPEFCLSSNIITVAGNMAKKIFLDLSTGQLYSLSSADQLLVATPCAGGIFRENVERGGVRQRPLDPTDGKDSFLRWFEEHAHRLHHDQYSVGTLIHDERPPNRTMSLLKYPTVSDTVHCSRAVTRGVEIIASAVYIQELNPGAMFVYSIRMRLLTPEDGDEYMPPEQRGFSMCHLVSRHWKICKHAPNRDEPLIEEVRGNGVIGYHPLLFEGGYVRYYTGDEGIVCLGDFPGCFVYQSCTEADASGTMEGHLQFIPGNMLSPTGAVFDVCVAPFPLQFPQYLY